jgi:hypothetical protein
LKSQNAFLASAIFVFEDVVPTDLMAKLAFASVEKK